MLARLSTVWQVRLGKRNPVPHRSVRYRVLGAHSICCRMSPNLLCTEEMGTKQATFRPIFSLCQPGAERQSRCAGLRFGRTKALMLDVFVRASISYTVGLDYHKLFDNFHRSRLFGRGMWRALYRAPWVYRRNLGRSEELSRDARKNSIDIKTNFVRYSVIPNI